MKILVSRIPSEGIQQTLTEKEGWVKEIVLQATQNRFLSDQPIRGSLSVSETAKNISVKGEIHFSILATCDRCLKDYEIPMDIFFDRVLSPLFESKRQKTMEKELDIELTEEDIGFSYYEGEEIDLKPIIQEQIVLAQPMRYLCKKECKGLCPTCGIDRNLKECSCEKVSFEKSPFSVLKKKSFKN